MFEEDCRRADEARGMLCGKALRKPPYRTKANSSTLYIEMDGAAINTRTEDEDGSTWRENKLGIIFSSDDIHFYRNARTGEKCHKITRREYVPFLGGAEEFKWHLFSAALRYGYDPDRRTVILSDGAKWIRNLSEEIFPGAIMILDLFHLKEKVHTFARDKFRDDESAACRWAEEICGLLENGKSEEVLDGLDKGEGYNGCNLYNYISSNRDRIDYPRYKAEGLFIGSGAIESGNKVVLQKRLKQAGMRWNPENAQPMLTLRAKYESDRWISDVEGALKKRYTIAETAMRIPRK